MTSLLLAPARRWHALDQTRRVEVYTRWTLLVLVWLTPLLILAQVADRLRDADRMMLVVMMMLALALSALEHVTLGRGIAAARLGRAPACREVRTLVAVVALGTLAAAPLPEDGRVLALGVLTSAVCWGAGALRGPRDTGLLLGGVAVIGAVLVRAPGGAVVALLVGAIIVATVRGSLWFLEVVHELDRARATRVALALAEERLRFGRDVHDVVGRRLSAIGLHADLAARLARRGDLDGATATMEEVREIAHNALGEARALARGYREVDLAQEVAGARSLLESAGVQVESHLDDVPDAHREPAGWVVREAVTNILRHSDARTVVLAYRDGVLRVDDDGRVGEAAGTPTPGGGSGLASLRERLAAHGGTLHVLSGPDGFGLRADLGAIPDLLPNEAAR